MLEKAINYAREELDRIAKKNPKSPVYLSYGWFGDDMICDQVISHLTKEGYDLVRRDALMFRHPNLRCKLVPFYCSSCSQESMLCNTCGTLSCNEGLCPNFKEKMIKS